MDFMRRQEEGGPRCQNYTNPDLETFYRHSPAPDRRIHPLRWLHRFQLTPADACLNKGMWEHLLSSSEDED